MMTHGLLRVLLIEDNPLDAEFILRELKNANGFEILMDVVSTEKDMQQVLERKIFDIVICVYKPPGFSITHASKLLDEFELNIPIVMVSGTITDAASPQVQDGNVYEFASRNEFSKLHFVVKRQLMLTEANDKILNTLVRTLEYKDVETRAHSERVTDKAVQIGRTMGLSEVDIVHLRLGALLHDIGKIGVRDFVLLKPERLTAEEMEQMKQHSQLGYDLLKNTPFLKRASDVVLYHHERWNGSGYPRGLKGTDIPLVARIFAVADVWDAMTSQRPYRAGLSSAFTLKYIELQSEILFDPDVVRAFLTLFPTERKP